MAKAKDPQYQEPEEKINDTPTTATIVGGETAPDEVIDPLTNEATIEREHTGTGLGAGGNAPQSEYTPNFAMGDIEEELKQTEAAGGPTPSYAEMSSDEKLTPEQAKESAMFTAEIILESYGEGKRMLGNLLLPISEKKLRRLEEAGEINLDIPINYLGQPTDVIGVVNGYNKIAYNKFGLRPEFKEKAQPILASELEKRGMVMSPLAYLGFLVLGDLRKDVAIGMQLRDKAGEIIDAMKEMTAAFKSGNYQPGTATAAAPTPAAPVTDYANNVNTDIPPQPVYQAKQATPGDRVDAMFSEIQSGNATPYGGNAGPAMVQPVIPGTKGGGPKLTRVRIRKPKKSKTGKPRGKYNKKPKPILE